MRVYVAGKFEDVGRVRQAQQLVREAGHTITFDWTPHYDAVKQRTTPLPAADLAALEKDGAKSDFDGARSCELLVLVAHPNIRGALVEMGIALSAGADVVVVGDTTGCYNIFMALPQVSHVDSLDDLPAALAQAATLQNVEAVCQVCGVTFVTMNRDAIVRCPRGHTTSTKDRVEP